MPEDTSSARAAADANYRVDKTKLGIGSTSSKPIPSAAEQKKLDDEERNAFESETGQKMGLNTLPAFREWKRKRAAKAGQAKAVASQGPTPVASPKP